MDCKLIVLKLKSSRRLLFWLYNRNVMYEMTCNDEMEDFERGDWIFDLSNIDVESSIMQRRWNVMSKIPAGTSI